MNESAGWKRRYSAFFWHALDPFDLKYQVEKDCGRLLDRDPQQTPWLTFESASHVPPNHYRLLLRFEAAAPDRNLYSLKLAATALREWVGEESFRRCADRAFVHWTRNLQLIPDPGPVESASEERYRQLVQSAIERESQLAMRHDDSAPIQAVQQDILQALRNGASFRSSHDEGGSSIYFNGSRFVKQDFGLEAGRSVLDSDEEMLIFLRNYFDFEAGRDTRPHKPPELEVWKFIQSQLTRP